MEDIKFYVDYVSDIVEGIGVLTIFFGALYSLIVFFISVSKKKPNSYIMLRQTLGKSILLGLEILIAADIMATVVAEPTLKSVYILGLIVLIRTFLSLSLQVEVEGRFPWQKVTKKD
ncbi:MAG: DUF1622 domain-containing protein [Bacteroidetes bacterium]|nr:DUF1622 domain-containing protein [Bacteroidota bacterium]